MTIIDLIKSVTSVTNGRGDGPVRAGRVTDVTDVTVIPYNPHTYARAYSFNRKISYIGYIGYTLLGGQRVVAVRL